MDRAVPPERLEGLSRLAGLTDAEALARTARFGKNRIVEATPGGWIRLLAETARDPMLWFLLGASALFAIVGDWTEAAILLAALVPFIGMDLYLHRRTTASIEGLSGRLATRATVERAGARRTVASVDVVPGDLAVVAAGEPFPADGVLVSGTDLQVDESTLTGEAFPVRKEPLLPAPGGDSSRVDACHWGMAGTRLLTGEALLRVVFTGGETLYGEIVRSAASGARGRTPLQAAVSNLVAVLLVVATLMCLVLGWVRIQQGHGVLDALLSAVTLAVAALPEEFPVVLTFFLGVGAYRLARRQALVRRGVVVENIGRVTCICCDKTGTLTEGRLQLAHRWPAPMLDPGRLVQLAAAASRRETGDPMDCAILDAAGDPPWERVAVFPFTEDRKRETGVVREKGTLIAAVKGAPEVVLAQCILRPEERAYWLARVDERAGAGHKVIACAWRELDDWPGGEPDRGFRLAGVLGLEDPVREGVADAVRECRNAGIRVIMVTGDHPATARAVAREIGLDDADVIARAVPAQKVELVRSLQASGEIVAVTGDGVNDVPALQAADIGIAMGQRGARSAREVAAIVLLDDNFRSIVRAIAEGRQLFANLQRSFQYLLTIHLPLVATAALVPLAGYPLLYLPVHIVLIELVIHPTALLVFEGPAEASVLAPAHKPARPRFFDRWQWLAIGAAGAAVTLVVMTSYVRSLGVGYEVDHARAMALVALAASSAGITAWLTGLRGAMARVAVAATLALAVLLVQTPFVARLLHLKPLHADDWMLAVGGGLLAALLLSLSSFDLRRRTVARL
ncbi:MAG TPA: cation-transporting P-type ATPase [Burkholderiales bacterium]|nr:cation-transporting P-type ATPase [Burkholderiales bacterium]